ncbi:hypothetical protein C4K68_07475 [Pokkaliibacter plantistimulans]|uniref:DUF6933 domain-containing protein n=1 Tax=Proteobacteria bacterium 228 TaxID=2083153 RepID=A0A2S5KTW3_9PROT|nr:hypothetical protein [Pokkaliibacter plantistimulans]PPC78082.1 hypothetical protein C4K68_07475 [Pokkaliibacter plantistimulans]
MLQFHLSKTLAKQMQSLLVPAPDIRPEGMQWYAQGISLLGEQCILAIEAHSRYLMVFCNLPMTELENFPLLFRERLWREVIAVCLLEDKQAQETLGKLVDQLSEQQVYQQGYDASINVHLQQAIRSLESEAQQLGRLPQTPEEEFNFGLRSNSHPTRYKGQHQPFQPVRIFADGWLGMLEYHQYQQQVHQESGAPDNVVPLRRH